MYTTGFVKKYTIILDIVLCDIYKSIYTHTMFHLHALTLRHVCNYFLRRIHGGKKITTN
jgi:hypothetical protein